MTALYAILAVVCLGGILIGAYLIGFDDGVKAEQMRNRTLDYIVCELSNESKQEIPGHALTHADMVQLEAAVKNSEKENGDEDED